MEYTRNVNHHEHYNNNYGTTHCHRPRDAYQLYELEHRVRTFPESLSSISTHVKEEGRVADHQSYWNHRGHVGRNVVHEDENINAQADAFITAKYQNFGTNKWPVSTANANAHELGHSAERSMPDFGYDHHMWNATTQWSGYPGY